MNSKAHRMTLLVTGLALSAAACGPAPNDPTLAETAEGSSCPSSALIDDGEDNNNQVMVQDGRSGYWYTFVDHEGSTIDPPAGETGGIYSFSPGGANGSKFAARMSGSISKANIVYAGMGCNLTDPKGTFDASKYGGLSFWAKKGPGTTPKVRIKVPDIATDPDGKICSACYNDFGMDLKLTDEWTKYILLFDALKQERGWGSPHPRGIDKTKLMSVQFQVNDKGQNYEIWIDDLGFTGCGSGAAPQK